MREKGPSAMTNTDLLAILIRTGTGKKNALDIARDLLAENGNRLSAVALLSPDKLMQKEGIGCEKAATLTAVFELVRRIMEEEPLRELTEISNPQMAYLYMEPKLRGLDHEEAWVMYLSRKCKLMGTEKLTSGTETETSVDVKTILAKALAKKAHSIILFHNHPGGDPEPGSQDIKFTSALKNAMQTAGMELADHIVIGDGRFFSFSDSRVLKRVTNKNRR